MTTTVETKETILIGKAPLEILSRSLEPNGLMNVARKADRSYKYCMPPFDYVVWIVLGLLVRE